MGKNKVPSIEEAKAKIEAFKNEIERSAKNKKAQISPTKIFLIEIKDVIKTAIENNVSYAQIARDINSIYSFKISTQTIRAFAQNEIGIKPRKKSAADPSTEGVKNEVFIEIKSSSEIKDDMANNRQNNNGEVTL